MGYETQSERQVRSSYGLMELIKYPIKSMNFDKIFLLLSMVIRVKKKKLSFFF